MEERYKDLIVRRTELETEAQAINTSIQKDRDFIVEQLGASAKFTEAERSQKLDDKYRQA